MTVFTSTTPMTMPPTCVDTDNDGVTDCDGDCDHADARVFPGAAESCGGLDTSCLGSVPSDEADGDGDGARMCDGDCDDLDE